MEMLWKSVSNKKAQQKEETKPSWQQTSLDKQNIPKEAEITYKDFINVFIKAGCIKFDKSIDSRESLISKYRS